MHSYGTSVLFVCRLCKASFQIVDDFIEHKKEEHSVEFRTSNCIVFEDILILNTGTGNDNDEEQNCGMLSTVKEKRNPVPSTLNGPLVGIDNNLTNVDLSRSPENISHDPADAFHPFPTPTCSDYQNQNDNNSENFSYQDDDDDDDDDETSDHSLEPNHDDFEAFGLPQASADVSFKFMELKTELTEFEMDPKIHMTDSVALTHSPQNPYVLLKKLSSKEIQKYSCLQNQQNTVQSFAELSSESRCKWCLEKFNSESELEIHCRVCILDNNNKRDRDRYCFACKKLFSSKRFRNIHKIRVHGTEEEKRKLCRFKCNNCQKVFMRKESLTYHMAVHKDLSGQNKIFECDHDQCSASFFEKYHLTRHQAGHSLAREFQCPELDCGKSFKRKHHLTKHLNCIHANIVELFNCTEPNCTSAFKYQSNIDRHIRTFHTLHTEIPWKNQKNSM